MAEKIKNISINAFETAVNSFYVPTSVVEWNGLTISIKKHLSLSDVAKFVDICTRACFDTDTNVFAPEIKDVAIRSCIVGFYTNITLPQNVEKQYELFYCSGIVEFVTDYIDDHQLNAIKAAINRKVDHIAAANIEYMYKQMNDFDNAINVIQDKMAEMFEGVDADDIKNVIGALSNGAIDEDKLVKAYIENRK